MKHLYICLSDGKIRPDEPIAPGFSGPMIGPLDSVYSVYTEAGSIKLVFLRDRTKAQQINPVAMRNALAFGLSESDAWEYRLTGAADLMVRFEGFFFGRWQVVSMDDKMAKHLNDTWFKETKLKQLSLQAQWQKHHASYTL
jgi:hypothetical protein